MVVIHNGCHRMVRQLEENYFDRRYLASLWGYSNPDFVRGASAFGLAARPVADPDDVPDVFATRWERPDEPFLLSVAIDTDVNPYPKPAFGRPLWDMEPRVGPTAIVDG